MLSQEVNEEVYSTYLYLHDGYLKELFMQQNNSLGGNALEAGVNIMKLDSFHLQQMNSNLLSIEMATIQGESYQIYVSTHCNAK